MFSFYFSFSFPLQLWLVIEPFLITGMSALTTITAYQPNMFTGTALRMIVWDPRSSCNTAFFLRTANSARKEPCWHSFSGKELVRASLDRTVGLNADSLQRNVFANWTTLSLSTMKNESMYYQIASLPQLLQRAAFCDHSFTWAICLTCNKFLIMTLENSRFVFLPKHKGVNVKDLEFSLPYRCSFYIK